MQGIPENCRNSMYAVKISQRLTLHWLITHLNIVAVPNFCTVITHTHSAPHSEEPIFSSKSSEEDLHVLIPTKTYSRMSMTSVTVEPIPNKSHTSLTYQHFFRLGHLLSPWLCLWWRTRKHQSSKFFFPKRTWFGQW